MVLKMFKFCTCFSLTISQFVFLAYVKIGLSSRNFDVFSECTGLLCIPETVILQHTAVFFLLQSTSKFESIYMNCLFRMMTNNSFVYKLYKSALQPDNSHRITYRAFYVALQKFKHIYSFFKMQRIPAKFRYIVKMSRSVLRTEIVIVAYIANIRRK